LRTRITRPGRTLDQPGIHLLRVEGGKVAELWVYPWDAKETDIFWADARV